MKLPLLSVLAALTFGSVPGRAGVVLNEVFYHAPGEQDALQWIELHNTATAPADVSGWSLRKGVQATLPAGTRIGPGGFLVLARDAAAFQQAYGQAPAARFEGALGHKGERIELVDAAGAEVDALVYKDGGSWPAIADGGSASLERICPGASTRTPANWGASVPDPDLVRPMGTPGRTNSIFSVQPVPEIRDVRVTPEKPSPGQELEVSAVVAGAAEIRFVEAWIRVAEAGREGEVRKVALVRGADGRWAGRIPGIPGGVVRTQVRAVDAKGAEWKSPSDNDLFPAVSTLVWKPVPAAAIPQFLLWQGVRRTRPDDGGLNQEDQIRWGLQNRIRMEADVARLWSTLALEGDLEAGQFGRLVPVLREVFERRNRWVLEVASDEDPAARNASLAPAIQRFRQETAQALGPMLKPGQLQVLKAWESGRPLQADEKQEPMILRNWLNLDPLFLQASLVEGATEEVHQALKKGYRALLAKRARLEGEVMAAMRDEAARNGFQEKISALYAEAQQASLSALEEKRFRLSQRIRDESTVFRRVARRKAPEAPKRERTALIHVDPSGQPTLIDFVSLLPRSAGYKIHLPKGRKLDGMTSLNLVFEQIDRFALSEPFAFELYRRVGTPAPKSGHARLTIDGSDLGYHVLIEQPNRNYLRRVGLGEDGHLYKATWRGDTAEEMHEKKSRLADGHADLVKTLEPLQRLRGEEQWKWIRQEFDVAETVDYFAVNMLLAHWDGYFNNYFAYHDTGGNGKWTFHPWDQDKAAGFYDGVDFEDVFTDLPLDYGSWDSKAPGWKRSRQPKTFQEYYQLPGAKGWWRQPGWFSGPMLSNPQYRARFVARVKHLLETEFTPERLDPVLDGYVRTLSEEVRHKAPMRGMDPDQATERLRKDAALLKTFVRRRRAFLLADPELQRAGPQDPALWK